MELYEIFIYKVGRKLKIDNLKMILNKIGFENVILKNIVYTNYVYNIDKLVNLCIFLNCNISYLIQLNYLKTDRINYICNLSVIVKNFEILSSNKIKDKNYRNYFKIITKSLIENRVPSLIILLDICNYLKCSIEQLLGLEDERFDIFI